MASAFATEMPPRIEIQEISRIDSTLLVTFFIIMLVLLNNCCGSALRWQAAIFSFKC
jgi:hypothetical protein